MNSLIINSINKSISQGKEISRYSGRVNVIYYLDIEIDNSPLTLNASRTVTKNGLKYSSFIGDLEILDNPEGVFWKLAKVYRDKKKENRIRSVLNKFLGEDK